MLKVGLMNQLERIVLKNIIEESQGRFDMSVMKVQYAKGLTGVGEGDLASAIKLLHDQGYIRRAGSNNLGSVYLTELGKLRIRDS